MITKDMKEMETIYMDWAATAPRDREIIQKAIDLDLEAYGNPSSLHHEGKKAKKLLSEARERAAAALKVKPEKIFFTSGGTESNHIPLLSLLLKPAPGSIVVSGGEHPSITNQCNVLKTKGWQVEIINPDKSGIISPEKLRGKISGNTALVLVQAVNNETGAIQPVQEISSILEEFSGRGRSIKFHVDGVQAAGKIPFDLNIWNPDTFSVSGHKLGALRGTGLIYVKTPQENFLRGGEQESGFRPGTENVAGAYSLALALEKHMNNSGEFSKGQELAKTFISGLKNIKGATLIPECRTPESKDYSPWIVQAAFSSIPGEVMVRSLGEEGICISTGSACSSKKFSRPVLSAMGVPPETARNGVRFSFGAGTTPGEIVRVLEILEKTTGIFR